jgi:hypothetical protein
MFFYDNILLIHLRTRNVSGENCADKTHILCSVNSFFEKSYRLLDNVEKYGTARQDTNVNITWRMRFAYWIHKAIDTYSEYVTPISFQRQQSLRERASMLTFRNPASYIKDGHTATFNTPHFLFF